MNGKVQRFDYGIPFNMKIYGQPEPPLIEYQNIKDIPIVMIVGAVDQLVNYQDTRIVHEKMKDTVVFYKEYELGHLSFFVAKDMTYFTQDVMS